MRFLWLFLAVSALGVMSLPRLVVERFPRAEPRIIEIRTSYSNASAEDVDQQITKQIEDSVTGLKGIERITSSSIQGASTVSVQFAQGTDLVVAAEGVNKRVAAIRRDLPSGAGTSAVTRDGTDDPPITQVALTSDRIPFEELFDLALKEIGPQLQSVPGVAQVTVSGGRRTEVQVRVDPVLLQSRGISLTQIQNAVRSWSGPSPAVTTRTDTQVLLTRTVSLADQIIDLGDILVASSADGGVYLKDVAKVLQTTNAPTSRQRLNGSDAVAVRVTPQTGVSWLEVDTAVRAKLQTLLARYGPRSGLAATITSEQVRFAQAAVDEAIRGLSTAGLVAALLVTLFLHNPRNALLLFLTVATALFSTVFGLRLLNLSLDTVSVMALVLVTGLLVDDAAVVMDSIYRSYRQGNTLMDATRFGLAEIGPPTIAVALISLGFFLALASTGGEAGHLFRQFGLVATIALLSSLPAVLVLTPALAARLANPGLMDGVAGRGPWVWFSRWWERGFNLIRGGYETLLRAALGMPWLPLLVGLILANTVLVPGFVRTEFAPREDESRFTLNVTLPPGTAIGVTDSATKTVEERLWFVPEVIGLSTSVRDESAAIEVDLLEKTQRPWSASEIAAEVRDLGLDIPTVQTRTSVPAPLGGGSSPGTSFIIMLRGPNMGTLGGLANDVLRILARTSGVDGETTSAFVTAPEYRAVVDLQRAADLGVTRQAVGNAVDAAIARAAISTFRLETGAQGDVVVLLDRLQPLNPAELGAIPVPTNRGTAVRLDQVATIDGAATLREIERYDRERQVTIEAVAVGLPLAEVIATIFPQLQQLRMPIGYDVRIAPVIRPIDNALTSLAWPLTLAIGFAFIVLAQSYGSLLYPWAVLAGAPVALAGSFIALRISGNTLNVFSIMALILVMALVTRHAAMLVAGVNLLRRQGIPRREAMIAAGQTRLRPILITSLSLGLAVFPWVSRAGVGAESRAPMAVVVIGGLVAGIFVTLVLVPCAYVYLDDLHRATLRFIGRVRAWTPAGRQRQRTLLGPEPESVSSAPSSAKQEAPPSLTRSR